MIDFWNIISKVRGTSAPEAPSASVDELKKLLEALPNEQVADFADQFYRRLCELNTWKLWGAGYVIAGGMSDDSFHYFRSWIIGKGEKVFEIARTDPDSLGPYIDDEEVDNELLEYVALEVLEARGVEEDPRDRSGLDADDEPDGEPFDEDTVEELYPKLASSG